MVPYTGTLEEQRASLTAVGAQLVGRGKALTAMEGQLAEQQRNLDRLTGVWPRDPLGQTTGESSVGLLNQWTHSHTCTPNLPGELRMAAGDRARLEGELAGASAANSDLQEQLKAAQEAAQGVSGAMARAEQLAAAVQAMRAELTEAREVRRAVSKGPRFNAPGGPRCNAQAIAVWEACEARAACLVECWFD